MDGARRFEIHKAQIAHHPAGRRIGGHHIQNIAHIGIAQLVHIARPLEIGLHFIKPGGRAAAFERHRLNRRKQDVTERENPALPFRSQRGQPVVVEHHAHDIGRARAFNGQVAGQAIENFSRLRIGADQPGGRIE